MAPKKLTSNSFRASAMGVSRPGISNPRPALLMSTSSFPPVFSSTTLAAAAMDSEDATSSAMMVTFDAVCSDWGILEAERAVAKTW
jgi:hypothetical protein